MPWKLYSDPSIYIFAWLGFYGGLLGAVAGVLVAGYWVVSRTRLDLAGLYTERGAYWFTGGWNWKAMVATLVGAVLSVGGAYGGPFPADGLIPFLKPLYDYNWAVGLVAAFVTYLAFSLPGNKSLSLPEISTEEESHERSGASRIDPATMDR
jgi:NCS1 family nucleobase:cation symporter-1